MKLIITQETAFDQDSLVAASNKATEFARNNYSIISINHEFIEPGTVISEFIVEDQELITDETMKIDFIV